MFQSRVHLQPISFLPQNFKGLGGEWGRAPEEAGTLSEELPEWGVQLWPNLPAPPQPHPQQQRSCRNTSQKTPASHNISWTRGSFPARQLVGIQTAPAALPPSLPHIILSSSLSPLLSQGQSASLLPYKGFNNLVFLLRSNFHLHKCSSLETLPSLRLTAEAVPALLCSSKRGESYPACCPPQSS